MDQFEDYHPARTDAENLYQRQQCAVFSAAYQPLGQAWVYRMARCQVKALGGQEIPTGVWSRTAWPSITNVDSTRHPYA